MMFLPIFKRRNCSKVGDISYKYSKYLDERCCTQHEPKDTIPHSSQSGRSLSSNGVLKMCVTPEKDMYVKCVIAITKVALRLFWLASELLISAKTWRVKINPTG